MSAEEKISPETLRFIEQNPLAAFDLRVSEIEQFANWHAGNLFVLSGPSGKGEGRWVKMHDSWGGDDEIVVHDYHPDDPDLDEEAYFDNSIDAFTDFLRRLR